MSRAPSNEKIDTTTMFTTKTAIAAWTNTCSRSPLRTAMMPAMPPRKVYGRELEGVAVEGATDDRDDGDDDRRHRCIEQDRQQHPDGRGRQEVAEDRAPGRDLERERRPGEQQADQEDDVVAVPERRAEAPDPGQQHRDDEDGQQQPAGEAREVRRVLADAELLDRLDVGGIEALAGGDDDLALGHVDARPGRRPPRPRRGHCR